jgi:hypothetical protein
MNLFMLEGVFSFDNKRAKDKKKKVVEKTKKGNRDMRNEDIQDLDALYLPVSLETKSTELLVSSKL